MLKKESAIFRFYLIASPIALLLMLPMIAWTIMHGFIFNFIFKEILAVVIGCVVYKFAFTNIPLQKKILVGNFVVYALYEVISFLFHGDILWGLLEGCNCTAYASTWALLNSTIVALMQHDFLKLDLFPKKTTT
jgi:hypothetical protein